LFRSATIASSLQTACVEATKSLHHFKKAC
jgi:hypothetical protein